MEHETRVDTSPEVKETGREDDDMDDGRNGGGGMTGKKASIGIPRIRECGMAGAREGWGWNAQKSGIDVEE
jgi:hypothetical protein